jgi:hypothetical protein
VPFDPLHLDLKTDNLPSAPIPSQLKAPVPPAVVSAVNAEINTDGLALDQQRERLRQEALAEMSVSAGALEMFRHLCASLGIAEDSELAGALTALGISSLGFRGEAQEELHNLAERTEQRLQAGVSVLAPKEDQTEKTVKETIKEGKEGQNRDSRAIIEAGFAMFQQQMPAEVLEHVPPRQLQLVLNRAREDFDTEAVVSVAMEDGPEGVRRYFYTRYFQRIQNEVEVVASATAIQEARNFLTREQAENLSRLKYQLLTPYQMMRSVLREMGIYDHYRTEMDELANYIDNLENEITEEELRAWLREHADQPDAFDTFVFDRFQTRFRQIYEGMRERAPEAQQLFVSFAQEVQEIWSNPDNFGARLDSGIGRMAGTFSSFIGVTMRERAERMAGGSFQAIVSALRTAGHERDADYFAEMSRKESTTTMEKVRMAYLLLIHGWWITIDAGSALITDPEGATLEVMGIFGYSQREIQAVADQFRRIQEGKEEEDPLIIYALIRTRLGNLMIRAYGAILYAGSTAIRAGAAVGEAVLKGGQVAERVVANAGSYLSGIRQSMTMQLHRILAYIPFFHRFSIQQRSALVYGMVNNLGAVNSQVAFQTMERELLHMAQSRGIPTGDVSAAMRQIMGEFAYTFENARVMFNLQRRMSFCAELVESKTYVGKEVSRAGVSSSAIQPSPRMTSLVLGAEGQNLLRQSSVNIVNEIRAAKTALSTEVVMNRLVGFIQRGPVLAESMDDLTSRLTPLVDELVRNPAAQNAGDDLVNFLGRFFSGQSSIRTGYASQFQIVNFFVQEGVDEATRISGSYREMRNLTEGRIRGLFRDIRGLASRGARMESGMVNMARTGETAAAAIGDGLNNLHGLNEGSRSTVNFRQIGTAVGEHTQAMINTSHATTGTGAREMLRGVGSWARSLTHLASALGEGFNTYFFARGIQEFCHSGDWLDFVAQYSYALPIVGPIRLILPDGLVVMRRDENGDVQIFASEAERPSLLQGVGQYISDPVRAAVGILGTAALVGDGLAIMREFTSGNGLSGVARQLVTRPITAPFRAVTATFRAGRCLVEGTADLARGMSSAADTVLRGTGRLSRSMGRGMLSAGVHTNIITNETAQGVAEWMGKQGNRVGKAAKWVGEAPGKVVRGAGKAALKVAKLVPGAGKVEKAINWGKEVLGSHREFQTRLLERQQASMSRLNQVINRHGRVIEIRSKETVNLYRETAEAVRAHNARLGRGQVAATLQDVPGGHWNTIQRNNRACQHITESLPRQLAVSATGERGATIEFITESASRSISTRRYERFQLNRQLRTVTDVAERTRISSRLELIGQEINHIKTSRMHLSSIRTSLSQMTRQSESIAYAGAKEAGRGMRSRVLLYSPMILYSMYSASQQAKEGEGSSKLGMAANVGSMFIPVVGTTRDFLAAYSGTGIFGEKLGVGDRFLHAGFGVVGGLCDIGTVFFGVGAAARAAISGARLGRMGLRVGRLTQHARQAVTFTKEVKAVRATAKAVKTVDEAEDLLKVGKGAETVKVAAKVEKAIDLKTAQALEKFGNYSAGLKAQISSGRLLPNATRFERFMLTANRWGGMRGMFLMMGFAGANLALNAIGAGELEAHYEPAAEIDVEVPQEEGVNIFEPEPEL